MSKENRRTIRLSDEQWEALRIQAEKLGTDRTGYIKLIVKLDSASEIIRKLRGNYEKTCLYCSQEIEKYEHYLDINGEILHEQCCYDKYGKQEGFDDDTVE